MAKNEGKATEALNMLIKGSTNDQVITKLGVKKSWLSRLKWKAGQAGIRFPKIRRISTMCFEIEKFKESLKKRK